MVASGKYDKLEDVTKTYVGESVYTCSEREGVYIKVIDPDDEYTIARGKIVRSDFISGNKSLDKGILPPNTVLR